eukprot:Pgem_evm1s17221
MDLKVNFTVKTADEYIDPQNQIRTLESGYDASEPNTFFYVKNNVLYRRGNFP